MIIQSGQFNGQGKLLLEGSSLGLDIKLELNVIEDELGITVQGELSGEYTAAVSVRIAPDEVGTYVVDAQVGKVVLAGRGKLESEPNLLLLWNEGLTQSASVALFMVNGGVGCRGFYQEAGKSQTWEVLINRANVHSIGGGPGARGGRKSRGNVVSLRPRR